MLVSSFTFLKNLDIAAFFWLNHFAGQSLVVDTAIIFFGHYVAFLLPVAFLGLIYYDNQSRKKKIWTVGMTVLSVLVAQVVLQVIHIFYQRLRPFRVYDVYQLILQNSYSFPSGHAISFFAFSFCVFLYNKKWGIWFFVATVCMTVARIMAGVHYPSDVIAGALLGIGIAYLVSRIGYRIKRQSKGAGVQ